MVAQLIGPGGTVDVSDREERLLGHVTVDGVITLPSIVEIANDVGNPVPVNGTVTANLGTLNGVATEVTLGSILTELGQKLEAGQPVALDAATLLALETIVVSGTVAVSNFPATQPVSGTVAVSNFPASVEVSNDSGNPLPVSGSVVVSGTVTANLGTIDGAATEATLGTRLSESDFDTKAGALTETAPATDTASSGLNGRLQRIAQRLTSVIALLPSSLGQKTKAASLAVTLASDSDAVVLGSGAATVGKVDQGTGGASAWKVDGSAVTQPISGTVTANLGTIDGASTEATLALIKAKTDNLDVALSTRTKPADTQTVAGTVTANLGTLNGAATETTLASVLTELGQKVEPNDPIRVANALVPVVHDYVSLGYTGDDLTSVVYKTGGAGGSTVATLALAYSSGVLASVTRS